MCGHLNSVRLSVVLCPWALSPLEIELFPLSSIIKYFDFMPCSFVLFLCVLLEFSTYKILLTKRFYFLFGYIFFFLPDFSD